MYILLTLKCDGNLTYEKKSQIYTFSLIIIIILSSYEVTMIVYVVYVVRGH